MIYTNSKIKQSNGPGVTPEIIFVISRDSSSRTGRGGSTLRPEGRLGPSHKTKSRGDPTLKSLAAHGQTPPTPREGLGGEKRCTGRPLQRTESSRETRFKNCAWVLVFPTSEGFTGWGQRSSCLHNPLGTEMRQTPHSYYLHSWTGGKHTVESKDVL